MTTTYELWDTETRNRVAVFDTEEAALAAVRHTLGTQGRYLAETLLLGTDDEEGSGDFIAKGNELIALAEAHRGNEIGRQEPEYIRVTDLSEVLGIPSVAATIREFLIDMRDDTITERREFLVSAARSQREPVSFNYQNMAVLHGVRLFVIGEPEPGVYHCLAIDIQHTADRPIPNNTGVYRRA